MRFVSGEFLESVQELLINWSSSEFLNELVVVNALTLTLVIDSSLYIPRSNDLFDSMNKARLLVFSTQATSVTPYEQWHMGFLRFMRMQRLTVVA
jgi:hypothetical protein